MIPKHVCDIGWGGHVKGNENNLTHTTGKRKQDE
jgi:hypothetical protein